MWNYSDYSAMQRRSQIMNLHLKNGGEKSDAKKSTNTDSKLMHSFDYVLD